MEQGIILKFCGIGLAMRITRGLGGGWALMNCNVTGIISSSEGNLTQMLGDELKKKKKKSLKNDSLGEYETIKKMNIRGSE